MTRVYECQECGLQGTGKGQFKMVRYKNIRWVMCLECIKPLKERKAAEDQLQEAHTALETSDRASWPEAHKRYKKAYSAASDARHRQNVRKYGLNH